MKQLVKEMQIRIANGQPVSKALNKVLGPGTYEQLLTEVRKEARDNERRKSGAYNKVSLLRPNI